MLKDAKCFRQNKVKQSLESELLVSMLLEQLFKEGVINYSTYAKARKEIGDYGKSSISE